MMLLSISIVCSNPFHTVLYPIAFLLAAIGFLLFLGGAGYATRIRVLTIGGRGIIVAWVIAGVGATLIMLGLGIGHLLAA